MESSDLPPGWEVDRVNPPYGTFRTASQSLKIEVEPDWASTRHRKLGEKPEAYTVALKTGRAGLGSWTTGARDIEDAETFKKAVRRAYEFMQEHARRTGEREDAADPDDGDAPSDAAADRSPGDDVASTNPTATDADAPSSDGSEGSVFSPADAAAGASEPDDEEATSRDAIFDEEQAVEGVAATEERAAVETLLSLRGYSDDLLVEEVRSLVGDGLRAVCHVDGRETSVVYHRDDVTPEYGQVLSAVRSLSKDHMERIAGDVGEATHLLLGYEDAQYLLVVAPDERGTMVAVDAAVDVPTPGIAITLRPLVRRRFASAPFDSKREH